MTAASKSIPLQGLRRRAMSLGAAKAFDYAMQFLLPVVLVRCLDTATFGEYRLLWLAVGTLMYVATFNMPQSLYVFLPSAEAAQKRLFINQTLVFMSVTGLAAAWAVSPWNPWLPATLLPLAKYGALVPAFVALWLLTFMLDFLPTIDERIRWQAGVVVGLSVLRVALLGAGAFFTGSMEVLLWLLLAYVLLRLSVLLAYIRRYHGLQRPLTGPGLFRRQFGTAAPLGGSIALFGLRGQGDQWIAAWLFSLSSFAAFSIAAVLGPIVSVFRSSVNEAFLPSMSRLQAAGDPAGMLALNGKANVMVGTLLYPMLAFAFIFAPEIVTVIYTGAFLEAVAPMRLYIVGYAVMVIETGSLVMLLDEGRFTLKVNLAMLVLSLAVSTTMALWLGLPGAAAGGVLSLYLDRVILLRRIARRTGVTLRKLQDWLGLALALLYGVLAALLAWAVVQGYFYDSAPLVRLIAGGTVLAATYGAALAFMRLRKTREGAQP